MDNLKNTVDDKLKNYSFYRNFANFITSDDKDNKVEIRLEKENGAKNKYLEDYVKLVDIDDEKNSWTFNVGYRDYLDSSRIVHGATINFKDMADKYDNKFEEVLKEIVQDPSFEGRLSVVTFGISKNDDNRIIDDMKDMFSRLNYARNRYMEHSLENNLKTVEKENNVKFGKFVYDKNTLKNKKFPKEPLEKLNLFSLNRVESVGKNKYKNSEKFTNRNSAIVELMGQFAKDMKRFGKFLPLEEREKITKEFLDSLSTKEPKYVISGELEDSKGNKMPFSVEVSITDGRNMPIDKNKSRDDDFRGPGGGGGGGGGGPTPPAIGIANVKQSPKNEVKKKEKDKDIGLQI